jgi:hypothetical protein
MAGHGSPPAMDQANNPARQVGRPVVSDSSVSATGSGVANEPIGSSMSSYFSPHETEEYTP